MKILICALTASAIAGFTPTIATAADLGRGYEELRHTLRGRCRRFASCAPIMNRTIITTTHQW